MASIRIQNLSSGPLSLDIPVPGGGVGLNHPKAIRALLGRAESVDVGDTVSLDDLNRTSEFQDLVSTGLVRVIVEEDPTDTDGDSLRLTAENETALGTLLDLYHSSLTPADADVLSRQSVFGNSDAPAKVEFGRLDWVADDVSDGTENGSLSLSLVIAGALTEVLTCSGLVPTNPQDVATKDYVDSGGASTGWRQQIGFLDLLTAADTLAIGALAMVGTEKVLIHHTAALGLRIETDLAGAVGAQMQLVHDKVGVGAPGDVPTEIQFWGNNTTPALVQYGSIQMMIVDATPAAEEGSYIFNCLMDGATKPVMFAWKGGITIQGLDDLVPTQGPTFGTFFDKVGAVGADGDVAAVVNFSGYTSTGLSAVYAGLQANTVAALNGSEQGELAVRVIDVGTVRTVATFRGDVTELTHTDDGALGPTLSLYQVSATPAASDAVGRISGFGRDSAANKTEYARIDLCVWDPVDGTEDGGFKLNLAVAGAMPAANVETLTISSTAMVYRGALGATSGPEAAVYFRKGAAGADADVAGYYGFYAPDDASNNIEWAYISAIVEDASAATKDSALALNLMDTNVDREVLRISPSVAEFTHTDDGTLGYTLSLYQISTTPADYDAVGRISFNGRDDGGNKTEYVQVNGYALDVTGGTEDGWFEVAILNAGAILSALSTTPTGTSLSGLAGATAGPDLNLNFSKVGAGANSDIAGAVRFYAKDDGSNVVDWAHFTATVENAGAAAKASHLALNLQVANADTEVARFRGDGLVLRNGLAVNGVATPPAQALHIADTAGDDAAAVNAILVVLENLGFVASA